MLLHRQFIQHLAAVLLTVLLLSGCSSLATSQTDTAPQTAFWVITPDRGFMGNQQVKKAVAVFARNHQVSLSFITDQRNKEAFLKTNKKLTKIYQDVIALPLFISQGHHGWQLAHQWLQEGDTSNLHLADFYGNSYLAVEDLSKRLRQVTTHHKQLLLVGYGAENAEAAASIRDSLTQLGRFASNLPSDAIQTAVYPLRKVDNHDQLLSHFKQTLRQAKNTEVVSLAIAPWRDNMMRFANWWKRDLPDSANLIASKPFTTQALTQWFKRTGQIALNAIKAPSRQDIGVVILTHGADRLWNNAIRQALVNVAQQQPTSFAFTMADQPVIAQAIKQLEDQNVDAIVLLRAFSLSSSFLPTIQRMLGLDVAHHSLAGHTMAHMMHGSSHQMPTLAAPPRIRTSVPVVTLGGVENSPSFAQALLTNAKRISDQPSKETLMIVAHGAGANKANQHWLNNLKSLTTQINNLSNNAFQTIEYATWREDWPDKREKAIAQVRKRIKTVNAQGSHVLVVPARVNGKGAAGRYLKGLDFDWSHEGFAQTPNFADWVNATIEKGVNQLRHSKPPH